MKLPQLHDGEWVAPIRKGFVMECCNPACRARHRLDHRVVKGQIQFRAYRVRRKAKVKKNG